MLSLLSAVRLFSPFHSYMDGLNKFAVIPDASNFPRKEQSSQLALPSLLSTLSTKTDSEKYFRLATKICRVPA